MQADADTNYFTPAFTTSQLAITIKAGTDNKLSKLAGLVLIARPTITANGRIEKWTLSGNLADELGLD